jgi:uroporphyrinogen-III synthase
MLGSTTKLEQRLGKSWEADFLHRVAEHVAKGDTIDETLASVIDFAVRLVSCDECIAYVREGEHLVPWVWKYSADRSIERFSLPIGRNYLRALSEHLQPIAISQGVGAAYQARFFSAWSTDPGETTVWIPFAARSQLLGALRLGHGAPHVYGRREFNALSSIGRMLGCDIWISQLENENSDLLLRLETRKPVERRKGIMQRQPGLSEEEVYFAL